jgi:hypothetical protein
LRELAADYGVAHTTLGRFFARPEITSELKQAGSCSHPAPVSHESKTRERWTATLRPHTWLQKKPRGDSGPSRAWRQPASRDLREATRRPLLTLLTCGGLASLEKRRPSARRLRSTPAVSRAWSSLVERACRTGSSRAAVPLPIARACHRTRTLPRRTRWSQHVVKRGRPDPGCTPCGKRDDSRALRHSHTVGRSLRLRQAQSALDPRGPRGESNTLGRDSRCSGLPTEPIRETLWVRIREPGVACELLR